MAITLTGTGGLFKRIGRGVYSLNSHNSYRGSADLSAASIVSIGSAANNIAGQYQSTRQSDIDSLYMQQSSASASMSAWPYYLQSLAQTTLIGMVDDDAAISSRTTQAALPILISQMVAGSSTVKANTVSATATAGSGNTGTAVCAVSVKGPDGKNREYLYSETIVATAISDSQSGTATAGSESWSLVGELAANDVLNYDWPLGSGASRTITATDPAGGDNYLANGDFEDWTVANTPDNWTITVGSAGTTVFKESTIFYRGAAALKILGNGSQLTSLKQPFNQATGSGSTQQLLPSTVYAFNCFLRVSSIPSAGTLIIELVDSGGTVINNDQSVANRLTKALTAATTSFAAFNGFFQTPRVLPTTTPFAIQVRLSVALDNAKSVYIDDAAMVPAQEFYQGGPYIAIFPGATNTVASDTFSVSVANDWGGGFQKAFERYFGMRSLGFQLPSATGGGETIPDSLIS